MCIYIYVSVWPIFQISISYKRLKDIQISVQTEIWFQSCKPVYFNDHLNYNDTRDAGCKGVDQVQSIRETTSTRRPRSSFLHTQVIGV